MELFREQPTRGPHRLASLRPALSFFPLVPRPPPRRALSPLLSARYPPPSPFKSLSVSLSLSLFSLAVSLRPSFGLSFARLIRSCAAVARKLGNAGTKNDEEGPSGPSIYLRASCDDPVDGFQKYTKVAGLSGGKAWRIPRIIVTICSTIVLIEKDFVS